MDDTHSFHELKLGDDTKWEFLPTGHSELIVHLRHAPCLFHRWMQRIFFGFKWRKKS